MGIVCWSFWLSDKYGHAPISADSVSAVYRGPEKNWKRNTEVKKLTVHKLKTCVKREWAVKWWNPAAQMRPVLDSSSFAPLLMLPRRTGLHSASSVLAVPISCRVIAVFASRKPLFINKLYHIYVRYTNITLYIAFSIICSRSWTYYPQIRGHTRTRYTPRSPCPHNAGTWHLKKCNVSHFRGKAGMMICSNVHIIIYKLY
jgi:hypothetical protein